MIAIAAGAFGSLIGSFLNVVVYRLPAGRSLVAPPSACGNCGERIRPYDNIPVLSWLLLRGRCRSCSSPISIRYPLVEAGTAVLFVAIAIRLAVPFSSLPAMLAGVLALLAFMYLASISIALALIDVDTGTLPNRIVLPAYVVGTVLLGTASLIAGDPTAVLRAAIGMASLWGVYFLIAILSGGMGFGDVKLAGVLGLFLGWVGWQTLVVGAVAAFIAGGLYAVALLAMRRVRGASAIPFGPWMLIGAWTGLLWGEQLGAAYLGLLGIH